MNGKILIVDDEESIVTLLKYNVEQAGYETEVAYTGKEALEKASGQSFALIVLDVMLPEIDGMEVCKQLRQEHIDTPVLMLTAKDEEFDKVLGLELGADDYMTKPFSPREVVARIKAILRRMEKVQKEEKDEVISIKDLQLFPTQYEAKVDGAPLTLTPKEFELLLYLARNLNRVLSREQLLQYVWNYDFAGDTRIVDVHVSHLREKIEPVTKKPVYIKTVRGLGYKMEDPDKNEVQ